MGPIPAASPVQLTIAVKAGFPSFARGRVSVRSGRAGPSLRSGVEVGKAVTVMERPSQRLENVLYGTAEDRSRGC